MVTRSPLLRMVLGNTYVLSALYLAVGLVTELLRRFHPSDPVERVSFALDALPARALQMVGLLHLVWDRYLDGQLDKVGLRVIFAFTTLVVIFLLALVLGAILSGIQHAANRSGAGD